VANGAFDELGEGLTVAQHGLQTGFDLGRYADGLQCCRSAHPINV
jgi:hypothetical protein